MGDLLDPVWLPAILALSGAIIGSFIGAAVIRIPTGRSILTGRSSCDGCGLQLRPIELVPLLSYAALRGRCRRCGARIAIDQPLAELGCALTALLAALTAPDASSAVMLALFGWALIAFGLLDARHCRLPDLLTPSFMLIGVLSALVMPEYGVVDRLAGLLAGYGILELVRLCHRSPSRGREGLGRDDAKLFGAVGAWLGAGALPFVLVLAGMLGLAYRALGRARGDMFGRDDRLPFGLLLVLATLVVMPLRMSFRSSPPGLSALLGL